jgi:ATP-binding cassette subfamily C protein
MTRNNVGRTAVMVALLGVAGLLEGLGIAALLPLIEILVDPNPAAPSRFLEVATSGLDRIGLQPSVPVLLGTMVLFMSMKAGVTLVAMLQVGFIVARVTLELRIRLLRAIVHAEWGHILRYPTGFISNAISQEAQRTSVAYREFCNLLAEGVQVLVYVGLAFLVSPSTAAAALLGGLAIVFVLRGFIEKSRDAAHRQAHILRSILARLSDALPSLKPLKAMGMERYLLPRLERDTQAFFEAQRSEIAAFEFINRIREPILVALLALGLWAVLTFGAVPPEQIVVLAALFYRTGTSLTNIQGRWASVVAGDASFRSIMEHIEAAEGALERGGGSSSGGPALELREELRLEDVHFSYGLHEVLRGADAVLEAGRFVALVGPSGSGKTTLTDLVTGLIRPTSGRILVDGVDLAGVELVDWRRHIGYVPQEPMLFSDTIRANVTMGIEGFSDDAVVSALEQANALDFVNGFEDRLDHRIGETGTNLSGGQRQRLAIARALLKKPSLLILDEPTTALDLVSEAEVCRTVASLRGELTVLAISHQPAIREIADEVWTLRDGVVSVQAANVPLPTR